MDGSVVLLQRAGRAQRELQGWRVVCARNPLAYPSFDYYNDLAPAFAYGLYARHSWRDALWNTDLETELGEEWRLHRGDSELCWSSARALVRQGFEGFRGPRARLLPNAPARQLASWHGWLDWLLRRRVPGGRSTLVRPG